VFSTENRQFLKKETLLKVAPYIWRIPFAFLLGCLAIPLLRCDWGTPFLWRASMSLISIPPEFRASILILAKQANREKNERRKEIAS
jgi:hypothetical protein